MSHIEKCKIKTEIKDDTLLSQALSLMAKEGYRIEKNNGKYQIDLRSKGITHYYTKIGRGEHWSNITLEKEGNIWSAKGDPWSIEGGFNTTIKTLEKSYIASGLQKAMRKAGYLSPILKKDGDKILIKARRG